MSIIKPPPLKIGDHYYYTLSSYDPVEIEVTVPHIIDEEVALAAHMMLADDMIKNDSNKSLSFDEALKSIPEELTDEWVAEHLEDKNITTVEELYREVRKELEYVNAHAVEEMKGRLCIEKLIERLCQEPPADELAQSHDLARIVLEAKLREAGSQPGSIQDVLGITPEEYDNLINQQSEILVKSRAALDAFASKRKLTVTEEEFPALLGMSPIEARDAIAKAKSNQQYEAFRQSALHAKVTNVLAAECVCTYHHETEEEARLRLQRITKSEENSS